MLNTIMNKIDEDLMNEDSKRDFQMLLYEDEMLNESIDDKLINNFNDRNGETENMLKNEMPFLFTEAEDTVVDADLITRLQDEIDYDDNFSTEYDEDIESGTRLQAEVTYDDTFDIDNYDHDNTPNSNLTDEVTYDDDGKEMNIDLDDEDGVNESYLWNLLNEDGEEESDATLLHTEPVMADPIDQAEPAEVGETTYDNNAGCDEIKAMMEAMDKIVADDDEVKDDEDDLTVNADEDDNIGDPEEDASESWLFEEDESDGEDDVNSLDEDDNIGDPEEDASESWLFEEDDIDDSVEECGDCDPDDDVDFNLDTDVMDDDEIDRELREIENDDEEDEEDATECGNSCGDDCVKENFFFDINI